MKRTVQKLVRVERREDGLAYPVWEATSTLKATEDECVNYLDIDLTKVQCESDSKGTPHPVTVKVMYDGKPLRFKQLIQPTEEEKEKMMEINSGIDKIIRDHIRSMNSET
jgi:hypothetical protein